MILETHGFSQDDLYPTLLHEFGHFLGLDHSQIYRHIAYDSVGGNDMYTPIMLPDSADDESVRDRLTDEDILSISNLYPATGFFEETGTIEGVVRREDQELPGINVIARQVGAVTDRIYSIVTGAYEYNRGTYKFAGLPSGEYQVFVEPLDRSYTGVSSVGRYSQSLMGQSFRNPPPAQFYHETGESSGRSVWTTIAVAEGETVGDIDLLVQLGDVPSDELDTQLLGLNSPEIGGVSGSGSSEFQFLLAPSEDEGRIELTVRADDPDAAFDVTISIDRFVTWADQPIRSSANGIASVLIAADGDIPLEPTRYFISIHNQGDREMTFVITASAAGTSTLCPFSVY